VIAPSLIPKRPGVQRKHDKRDAADVARFYRAGELTSVRIPSAAEERVRDIVRCRETFQREVLTGPGADNSAEKTRHKRSRDGNRYLKLVFHTAIRAAQYHPEIRQCRRLARRKGKIVARALIAKELASIVYWVLRKQEAFNGTFRGHVPTPKPARWPRLASPNGLTGAPESRTNEWEASRRAGE